MSSSESLRELIIERLTAAAEEIFGLFERTVVQYEEEIDRQRRLLDITWKPEIKLHRIVGSLRDLITERLMAAAREEIFGLFERTFVQYEEEIDRQRRLLDITWKPEIKLHRIDQPQHYVCKEEEEEVVDDQLSKQERASSLNQEEPEPLQLKEEQEEPEPPGIKQEQEEFSCSSQPEEHLVLKLEADSLMETCTDEESELSEPQPKSESPDQGGIEYVDSGSTRNAELNPKKRRRHCRDTSHSNNVDNSPMSESQSDTDTDKKSVTCDICGKTFKTNFNMRVHRRSHTVILWRVTGGWSHWARGGVHPGQVSSLSRATTERLM
ncbi:zinc finger and SCAN domain-containing protein 21-like isoform X3 [Mugil cephalus]|uniref:zinc finger and SCAN domain-containing protein 21-like isoform X3 n=1 Tax=Mugil cephalus TaxID=48193 RepID=UPI001FB7F601|nr:zinc finger and SCAN domain-containing protein 21-like isoform X3 [Mugil cephalus]